MSLVNTYTFEEGTDGASIPTGSNGVVAEGAAVNYDAANAIHGSICAKMTVAPGSLVYALPASGSNSWSDSVYCKIGATAAGSSILVSVRTGTSTTIAKVNLDPSTSKFRIMDSTSTVKATSTATWTTGQVMRADSQYSYDGANISMTVKFFLGSNSEGTTPDDTISATFAVSGVPTRFSLGGLTASWTMYYDTYRQYNSSTDTISPYNPGSPPIVPLQIYNGSSLVAASAYVAVNGGGGSPSLDVDFENGTTGGFTFVRGATVGSAYAFSGTNGCRLTPEAGDNYATLTYGGAPAGHAWARFKANFRIVTITNPANTYTNVFEVGNALVTSPKNQFTIYVNGPDLYMDFRTGLDATLLDNNVAVGVWHTVDVSINFGTTSYTAYVTYDGVRQPDFISSVACTPSTVGALWVGYPSTATDQTTDWDNVQLYVGDSDPALSGINFVPATLSVD